MIRHCSKHILLLFLVAAGGNAESRIPDAPNLNHNFISPKLKLAISNNEDDIRWVCHSAFQKRDWLSFYASAIGQVFLSDEYWPDKKLFRNPDNGKIIDCMTFLDFTPFSTAANSFPEMLSSDNKALVLMLSWLTAEGDLHNDNFGIAKSTDGKTSYARVDYDYAFVAGFQIEPSGRAAGYEYTHAELQDAYEIVFSRIEHIYAAIQDTTDYFAARFSVKDYNESEAINELPDYLHDFSQLNDHFMGFIEYQLFYIGDKLSREEYTVWKNPAISEFLKKKLPAYRSWSAWFQSFIHNITPDSLDHESAKEYFAQNWNFNEIRGENTYLIHSFPNEEIDFYAVEGKTFPQNLLASRYMAKELACISRYDEFDLLRRDSLGRNAFDMIDPSKALAFINHVKDSVRCSFYPAQFSPRELLYVQILDVLNERDLQLSPTEKDSLLERMDGNCGENEASCVESMIISIYP